MFWKKKDHGVPPPESSVETTAKSLETASRQEETQRQKSWLSRLSSGLSKSAAQLGQGIADVFTKRRLDTDTLAALEDMLIEADLGPKAAARVVADFSAGRFDKEIEEKEIRVALAESIASILTPVAKPVSLERRQDGAPMVVLVCGVNGVGKTTTIGKIAWKLSRHGGRKIMIAAGDTFRAAAAEQLAIWAERAGCELIAKDTGADAAAVAYEAYEKAKAAGADVLFIDTAGRLHNKTNLMAELQKIVRVLKKQDESLPHAVLLVLDATTGQNAHEQVRVFQEMLNVTGLVVTKLDGSARGGVVVGLAERFGLPIHMIGVGEGAEDLQPFDPHDFARALTGA